MQYPQVSQSSGEFRALEAVKGSNGWARYCVGPEQRVIFGGRSGEPEHIDQLGSQQYWSDESVLSLAQVSAVGKCVIEEHVVFAGCCAFLCIRVQ